MSKNNSTKTRCKSLTKEGKPCGTAAMEGGLCFFHANPDKARELGRIGGRKNRRGMVEAAGAVPPLDNKIAVGNKIAELVDGICSGRIHPKIGSGVAPLLSLQMRTIEANHERRIEALEKQFAEAEAEDQEGGFNGKGGSTKM